jgi:MoaA/NifB/PqqE/SkfB family radical SAM enzyme
MKREDQYSFSSAEVDFPIKLLTNRKVLGMLSKKQVFPIHIQLNPTNKCNLKCLHCGSSAGIGKSDELTKEEGINLIRDLAKIGFKGVALMGGEVFTRKEWYDFSKEIKNNNIIDITPTSV